MKTILTKLTTAALSLAALLVTGSAWADTDELGLTPKHWYKFNGNFNSSGGAALTIKGENTSNFFEGVNDQAMKVVDGKTHPHGSGVQYGDGAWSVVTVAKAVFDGSNLTFLWTTGTKSAGWFGLLANPNGTAVVAKGNSNGVTETSLSASVNDIGSYHVYAVVYDGGSTLSLYVDGVLSATKTDFAKSTSGNFQWGALNGGIVTGTNRPTGSGIDDWRLYQKELSKAQIIKVTKTFIDINDPLESRMFNELKLTGNDCVSAGTYGDIVVPASGYSAMKYVQQTTISATTGSPSGLFKHGSWGYIQPHTIGMWVKVDELPTSGEKDIYGFSTDSDPSNGNNGYKLAVTAEGKFKIGRKNNNGGWNGGNYYTTSHVITAGEWFYLTVSFNRDTNIDGSASPVAIRIYVNGSQVFSQDNGFSADLGGSNFSSFYVGAEVSVAGIYGDSSVISDAATIKNWATNEDLVAEYLPFASKRVINVNFASSEGAFSAGDTSSDGLLAGNTPKSSWVNPGTASGTAITSGWDTKTQQAVELTGISVSWTGGVYGKNSNIPVIYSYLDESGDDGNVINFTGIPFTEYDIIVYQNNDTNDTIPFHPIKVNDVAYTWNDALHKTIQGTSYWGHRLSSSVVYGVNALRISGLTTGNITIKTGKRDNSVVRGAISAIQIVETISRETVEISEDTNWADVDWTNTPDDMTIVDATFTGNAILTLDANTAYKTFNVFGNNSAEQVIGVKRSTQEQIPEFIDKVTLDASFKGTFEYQFDATTASFTASDALMSLIKTADNKMRFVFKGANTFGATLSYGDTQTDTTINTHIVFDGGTHTWHKLCDNKTLKFGANATVDNPTMLVTNGATLNWEVKNPCGWGADAANTAGILRIDDGSKVIYKQVSGTAYWTQQIYIEPGAEFVINDGNTNDPKFRIAGGTNKDACQIYVPARDTNDGKVAKITQSSSAVLWPKNEGTAGMAIFVGVNSTLEFGAGVKNDRTITKYGDGKLVIKGTGFATPLTIAEGSLGLTDGSSIANLTINAATEINVASGSATISALTGSGSITKTGAGTLNLPAAYTQAITLSGGLINRTATNTVTINGTIDLGTTVLPLSWTLDTASTGTLKLPAGFAFGEIVNATQVPEGMTFLDSADNTIDKATLLEIVENKLVLKKSTINIPYDVSGVTEVAGDLTFGVGGAINILNDSASLTLTGALELPADGQLPISFSLKGEYAKDTAFTLITASNGIKKNDVDAQASDFTLTATLLEGMTGVLQLADNNTKLQFVITSETITKAAADVLNAGHLIRRFDANRGITKDENGSISQWNDISGNSDNAVAYDSHALPTYVTGDARNYVDFGVTGSNKDLGWTQVTTLRTAIVVVDIEENWCAFLLGDSSKGTFHRGYNTKNGNVVASYGDSREVKYSGVRDNGQVVEWKTTVIPTGFRVISVTTTENQSVSRFTQDRSNGAERTGGKKLSEVLIFDSVLTDEQLAAVEAYLTTKWRIGFKNTVTLPAGETKWSAIDWDADQFYADAPTEITLGGNTTLVYDMATAPVGNIIFVKGDYTLEQVVTANAVVASDVTIPADETWTIQGGATEAATYTINKKLTVNGTLKTEGYVNLNANNTVSIGTLEVVSGQATLKFDGQGISNGGTITIDAGATAIAASGDAFSYADDASFTLNVYGTLNMDNKRWTYKGSSGALNIYGGASITGTGDGKGALDMYIPITAAVNNQNVEATVSAPFKYSADTTFNVDDGMTLKLTGAVKSNQTRTLTKTGVGTLEIGASQGNVTVVVNAGKVVLNNASYIKSVSTSDTGSVEIAGGEYDVGYVRDFSTIGNITTSGEGKIKVVATVADDGLVKIVNIPTGLAVEVYDIGGVDKLETEIVEGTITVNCSIKVDGAACYYDWTFTNTVQTTGAKTIATSSYSKNQGTLEGDNNTSYADQNEAGLYTSLHTSVRPHANLNWSPVGRPWTIALAGKMSEYPNTVFISLGGVNKTFFFSTTDTPNEVRLVYGTNQNNCEEITVMSVPAASTLVHVYEITLSADGKDLTVYLDGIEWASSHKEEGFEMNSGIQVSGWYGGNYSSNGYKRDGDSGQTDTAKVGRIKMLRVYDTILGPNAMAKLSEEFQYNPQYGAYSRTLDEATEDWSATAAWTDDDGEDADIPANGSVANLTVGVNSELTINAGEEIHQESISIVGQNNGGQTLRIKAGSGQIINDGATVITTPVTIEYGAMTIAGGPTKINGSVTFDFSDYPIDTVYGEGRLGLTGLCDAPESDDKTTWPAKLIVPANLKGRTMTLEYTSNKKYELVFGIERSEATMLYLTLNEEGTTTIDNDTVFTLEDGTTTALRFYTEDEVILTGTGAFSVASGLTIPLNAITIADGATAKLADNLFRGAITVNAGAVFDVNGKGSSNYAITLAGGELANTGDATFVPSLTLTANSSVNLTGNGLSIQSSDGGWDPTTITLGENTLTKKGDGQFTLVATTITGTGTLDIQAGKVYSSESTSFANGTIKIAAGATYQQRGGARSTTVAKIIGAEGALLQNNNNEGAGTMSAFTLEGALTLVGTGTFGTITLAENATIDIATQRGLTIAGTGSVKATITDAELVNPFTLFRRTGDTSFSSITLYDAQGQQLTPSAEGFDDSGNYVVTFNVSVTIPNVANTTKVVKIGNDTIQPTTEGGETYIVVPGSNITVTYTANAGYLPETPFEKSLENAQAGSMLDVSDVVVSEASALIIDPTTGEIKSYDTTEEAINANNGATITITKNTEVAVEKMTAGNTFKIEAKTSSEKFSWTDDTNDGGKIIVYNETAQAFTVTAGTTDNGLTSFMDYLLNLKPQAGTEESPDKPYIKAAEQTTAGRITFNFFHGAKDDQGNDQAISPREGTGFTVKYAIEYADSLNAASWTKDGESSSNWVEVDLPQPDDGESAVRYFKPVFSFE